MQDEEFAKLMKQTDPEIKVYLNQILKTVNDKNDFQIVMDNFYQSYMDFLKTEKSN
jgi:hypothetical protein